MTWSAVDAETRFDGATPAGELGRRIAVWESEQCLFVAAPNEEGATGTVYAEVGGIQGIRTLGSGGQAWGTSASSYLATNMSVNATGRIAMSQAVDNDGEGSVFLLNGADLCGGWSGAVDDGATLTLRGNVPSAWFGSELSWLNDVDGDGIEELAIASPMNPGGGTARSAVFIWREPTNDGAVLDDSTADVVLYGNADGALLLSIATGIDAGGPGTPWLLLGGTATSKGGPSLFRLDGTELRSGSISDEANGGLVSYSTDRGMSAPSVSRWLRHRSPPSLLCRATDGSC